jgi:nicotinamidase-related amidase
LIDVINDFDFPEGEQLLHYALPAAKRIAELKERAHAHEVPVIYVNDNFGRWRSDFQQQIEHCSARRGDVKELVDSLRPGDDDYFILKPKHSGFFSTSLEVLLESLNISRLILTGFAADICVLYTANDAYMRDFALCVPEDCVASESKEQYQFALNHMRRQLRADVKPGSGVTFE